MDSWSSYYDSFICQLVENWLELRDMEATMTATFPMLFLHKESEHSL
ncbi:MAG TPA: hypothetical protein PLM34_08965 [Lentimicrobium sp.]|nr:hypothetical protein [Lentimicrobium sp.]